MLIALLFLLSSATAATATALQPPPDGLRRSRQLDLGLQDVAYSAEKAPTTIGLPSSAAGGYLPPEASSSAASPRVVASQSQQSFEFKNAVGKEEDSFKSFDTEYTFSGLSVSKPSRDLVPPFNDIELEALEKNKAAKKSEFISTTRPPTTRETPKSPKPVADKAEATNDFRSYLPPQPEIAGAAQTAVAVVRPAAQNDDDHHHHHHHEHGDICADAFHSFLCAALKPRKRITGALPNLRGQSSFVQYQKVSPNLEREPASSNALQNEYLPPRTTASPPLASASNAIKSTQSPRTTQRVFIPTSTLPPYSPAQINPEPSSSNDRFYLPPLTDNGISATPLINLGSSNQPFTTFKPSSTTRAPFEFSSPLSSPYSPSANEIRSTVKPSKALPPSTAPSPRKEARLPKISTPFPLPSNEDRSYLPPDPNPLPAASFVSPSNDVRPTPTVVPQTPIYVSSPPTTTFVPLSSGFNPLPLQPKLRPLPVILSSTPRPPPTASTFSPLPTVPSVYVTSRPVFRPISSFAPLPSNPDGAYLPPQPKFQSASNLISTTSKPTTTTKRPLPTTPKLLPQPSIADNSYLPPDPSVQPAAAQINAAAVAPPQVKNPFHHGRDLCTDPFHSFLCVGPKPRKRITGALPPGSRPESSLIDESRLKPAPSFQSESRVKPSQNQPAGYRYPKPLNPFPSNPLPSTVSPSTGYSYPKPDKIFPLPSQQNQVVFTTAKPTTPKPSAPKKPEPTVLRASEARVATGYQYPKPEQKFPLPSRQETTTRRAPLQSTTGYSYPKPQKPFPLPTEQKEVRYPSQKPIPSPSSPSSSTLLPSSDAPKGYRYPKPEQGLKLPEKKGYSYPKPQVKFELPTEISSRTLLPESAPDLGGLRDLGSAEFIPVNKLDSRNPSGGSRGFGERLKKRERRPSD